MNEKTDNLTEIKCPKCGWTAKEVIFATENIRKGWYCTNPQCKEFTKAIQRERIMEK